MGQDNVRVARRVAMVSLSTSEDLPKILEGRGPGDASITEIRWGSRFLLDLDGPCE